MFSSIYVERAVSQSSRVQEILQRFNTLPIIPIEQFGEVFNRNKQNFRLQKQHPALILAHKYGHKVLPTPQGYGFEHMVNTDGHQSAAGVRGKGFYFSHMLNCVYDCRYCFLQGMYRSANYVLFVNYEDFVDEILATTESVSEGAVFYSGYDCDSLALEPVSGFCEFFLPVFAELPEAHLEIRTKSTQLRFFLEREPLRNCIIAMSFSPRTVADELEHKVPALNKRIDALQKLQQAGWPVALRFEPVIAGNETIAEYRQLFEDIFSKLDSARIQSCSLGEFRLPQQFYKRMVKLYPHEPLLARETMQSDGMVSLRCEAAQSWSSWRRCCFTTFAGKVIIVVHKQVGSKTLP